MEPVWGSWTGGKHRLKAGSTSEPQCYLDTSPWWPLTIRLRWDRWAVWQPDSQKKYSRETAFLVKVVKCSIFICQRMWSDLSCKHSGSEQYVPVRHHYKKTFKNSLLDRRNNVQKLHKSVWVCCHSHSRQRLVQFLQKEGQPVSQEQRVTWDGEPHNRYISKTGTQSHCNLVDSWLTTPYNGWCFCLA